MTKKQEFKEITVEELQTTELICDWCKRTLLDTERKKNKWGGVTICFGYGSIHDGTYTAEICDDCFSKKLLNKVVCTQ